MEWDSSLFVPETNCFCWECREAESCVLEMRSLAAPGRLLLMLPKKHTPAIYLFHRDSIPLEAEEGWAVGQWTWQIYQSQESHQPMLCNYSSTL